LSKSPAFPARWDAFGCQIRFLSDKLLAKGKAIEEICRDEQICLATFYRWKQKYGDLGVQEAKRLKALEIENTKLKRILAEAMLANDALKEFLAKKHDTC